MRTRTFRVVPRIPEELDELRRIAYNTWWTWNPEAVELFRWMDSDLWERTHHNPVLLLGRVDQERLRELAEDDVFISHLREESERLRDYLDRSTWFDALAERRGNGCRDLLVATFIAEIGLHESIPVYSGGLGVLAGDTMKSASELGLPMVGVTLLYRNGYFAQYLGSDGWQRERYFINDYSNMPVEPVAGPDGNQVRVEMTLGGRRVQVAAWQVQVGRTRLFMLDTNLDENDPTDREITGQLYGGDKDMRIRQELVLGIGGLRMLDAMGMTPAVRHLNEGHSGFLIVERMRQAMAEGLTFPEARELVTAGNVFTTHTPVPAGNEEFSPELIARYLGPTIEDMGLSMEEFLSFGRLGSTGSFSMTVFALRFSRYRNGVSRLHGEVSRDIWKGVWPRLPREDSPIEHVTNGIHPESWIAGEMARLLGRYVGPRWSSTKTTRKSWEKVSQIPDAELWLEHVRLRQQLVSAARIRWEEQMERMGYLGPSFEGSQVLDPDALTIGFARRFAAYKRGNLLLRDEERLLRLLSDPDRPVQFIFAGKAHPHDDRGKELIREIVQLCTGDDVYGKVVYLEDYSMDLARRMVQGVDVWLNTPRPPMEACGTSGMKACFNGVLHCSVPDGWWAEAYRPAIGWSIGDGEVYDDPELQDRLESRILYNLLEDQIVPLFYSRDSGDIPTGWVAKMKASIAAVAPAFSSNRMLAEYAERFYIPAFESSARLTEDDYAGTRETAAWMERVRAAWEGVSIAGVRVGLKGDECRVGDSVPVEVVVRAPDLGPGDLVVQVQHGRVEPDGWLTLRTTVELTHDRTGDDGMVFAGQVTCESSGQRGVTVRVLPGRPGEGPRVEPGLVCWWE